MYKCDKSNSHRKSICIKKYISKYIQCKPPWYSEKEETDITKPCMDSTKLEEYKNVTFELSTNKTLRYETDCYQDNCKQALWKMKKMVELPSNADNVTKVTLKVQTYVSFSSMLSSLQVSNYVEIFTGCSHNRRNLPVWRTRSCCRLWRYHGAIIGRQHLIFLWFHWNCTEDIDWLLQIKWWSPSN